MPNYGHFSDNPQTEWITNPDEPDRDMKLLRNFSYTDPQGKIWMAPAGSTINGASIPRPLWSTVGSPYTDDYRNATIVHDIAVSEGSRKAADKMFYYACLAGGCHKPQARLLYLGVRIGSWGAKKKGFLEKLKPKNLLYRLKSQPRMDEEIKIRDTFERVRVKLDAFKDTDDFDKMEALIDAELD
jgi:hypothetical protein